MTWSFSLNEDQKKLSWCPFLWLRCCSGLLLIEFRDWLAFSGYIPNKTMFSKLPIYMQRSLKGFLASSNFSVRFHYPIKLLFLSLFFCLFPSLWHFQLQMEFSGMLISEITASQNSSGQFSSFTNALHRKQRRKKRCAGTCFLIPYEKKRSTFAWYMIADECLQRIHLNMKINDVGKHQYNSFQFPMDHL